MGTLPFAMARSGYGRRNRDAVRAFVFKKGGGDRKIAGNRCGERRRVQGQGGWCCSFRGKKESVADRVVGAGQQLLQWLSLLPTVRVHAAGWHGLQPGFQPVALGYRGR